MIYSIKRPAFYYVPNCILLMERINCKVRRKKIFQFIIFFIETICFSTLLSANTILNSFSNKMVVARSSRTDNDFKISIFREYPNDKCTSGYLSVNGTIICYTLEKPWKNNRQNISSIPAGTYNGILRYDHNDHWRIELVDVPDRTNIQIHIGNVVDNSKGCILVGTSLNNDLCSITGGTSTPAYAKLETAFYGTTNPVSTPDKNITVEIKDAGT